MGLIKATMQAGKTILKDQWLEFVTFEAVDKDVLVQRAYPQASGSNKGNPNVLNNGARIVVPEGFAMMVVDQGKIAEFTAEPGEFTYDTGTEPSIFYGQLGQNIIASFKKFTDRIKFSGDTPKDTRVYYVNLREITGNKFGTATPVPFDDPKYGITIDIRFYGMYSVKVSDPIVLIANIIGTMSQDVVHTNIINDQLRGEFMTSLISGLSQLADREQISYNKLPIYQEQLSQLMNDKMDDVWKETRGLEIISVALESVSVDEKSREDIRKYDEMFQAEKHGQGMMTAATAQAMRDAAKNENGTAGMFMGMNASGMMQGAMQTGATMAGQNAQPVQNTEPTQPTASADTWTCECGTQNNGKFCTNCGKGKPEPVNNTNGQIKCPNCGVMTSGKFCHECGTALPQEKRCPKCGEKVDGKFCSNCGTSMPE